MKTIGWILTVIIYVFGFVFFTPIFFATGLPDSDTVSMVELVGMTTSTFAGTIFTISVAKKFKAWFESHIK